VTPENGAEESKGSRPTAPPRKGKLPRTPFLDSFRIADQPDGGSGSELGEGHGVGQLDARRHAVVEVCEHPWPSLLMAIPGLFIREARMGEK
jgi:hypothetical protein